jgi:hypothetical protein
VTVYRGKPSGGNDPLRLRHRGPQQQQPGRTEITVPQRYDDTWHQLEAADERAWLDVWARAHRGADRSEGEGLHYGVIVEQPELDEMPTGASFITA